MYLEPHSTQIQLQTEIWILLQYQTSMFLRLNLNSKAHTTYELKREQIQSKWSIQRKSNIILLFTKSDGDILNNLKTVHMTSIVYSIIMTFEDHFQVNNEFKPGNRIQYLFTCAKGKLKKIISLKTYPKRLTKFKIKTI